MSATRRLSADERECGQLATELVYWPGSSPRPMCADHVQGALNIANAMGFHLATGPAVAGDVCASIVRVAR